MFSLLGVLCLASLVAFQNATKCFECLDLPHPVYCNKVTTCPQGQICVVEAIQTAGDQVLFNSGCQSRQTCNARRKRDVRRYSFITKRTDRITCNQCCEGDFCNYQGCGKTAPKQPERGPICFQCPALEDPENCKTLGACGIGKICMLYELHGTSSIGGLLYKSQCVTQIACQSTKVALVGKKRRDTLCHTCCYDDFCNDHCETFVVPTTSPTSPSTSTSTAPPTTTTNPTTTTAKTTTPVNTTPTTTTTATTTTTPTTPKPKPTTTESPAYKCHGHHYYHFTSHNQIHMCYKFHNEHKTWTEAEHICRNEGGHLAIVDTQAKWDVLQYRMDRDHSRRIYIGARGHSHPSHFHWTNGDRMTYTQWDNGEPNGNKSECVYVSSENHWRWHDIPCTERYQFACTIDV